MINIDQLVSDTSERYERRTAARAENLERVEKFGPLGAEVPARAAARVFHLNERLKHAKAEGGASAELAQLGLERILGVNDLVSVSFLEGGFRAARTVARIKVKSSGGAVLGYGTGFMVSPTVILTNEHVLKNALVAKPSVAEFDFRESSGGSSPVPREFRLLPDRFFASSKELDCTFVAVEEVSRDGSTPLSSFGWNKLISSEGKIAIGEKLNIIQHPGGQPQQVALRANELSDVLENHLHYHTDTAPGSSGSPVYNDQWEVIALHHSGVPRRDAQGRILADDGTLWRQSMGEQRVDWISNEGVRISRILSWLSKLTVPDGWLAVRDLIINSPEVESSPHNTLIPPISTAPKTTMPTQQTATLTVPLNITFSIGTGGAVPTVTQPRVQVTPPATPTVSADKGSQTDLAAALALLKASEARPYLDEERNAADRVAFYQGIEWTQSPSALFSALSRLLRDKHRIKPAYRPVTELYPWIDLHEDGKIRSIYSGKAYDAEEFIRLDLEIDASRKQKFAEILTAENFSPALLSQELDTLEASLPYNCEHVVPQSWFSKREPMRGDLHHLFACESGCNSFRSNIPYYDFPEDEEAIRNECGRREQDKFEPEAGHGAVARATLYFLLRYPGLIGDNEGEFTQSRLELLLSWHADNPLDTYEMHRNQAIFERQGNRNPLIDFPQHARLIEFRAGFGG